MPSPSSVVRMLLRESFAPVAIECDEKFTARPRCACRAAMWNASGLSSWNLQCSTTALSPSGEFGDGIRESRRARPRLT